VLESGRKHYEDCAVGSIILAMKSLLQFLSVPAGWIAAIALAVHFVGPLLLGMDSLQLRVAA